LELSDDTFSEMESATYTFEVHIKRAIIVKCAGGVCLRDYFFTEFGTISLFVRFLSIDVDIL